jgi:hypothetical protein
MFTFHQESYLSTYKWCLGHCYVRYSKRFPTICVQFLAAPNVTYGASDVNTDFVHVVIASPIRLPSPNCFIFAVLHQGMDSIMILVHVLRCNEIKHSCLAMRPFTKYNNEKFNEPLIDRV